jgi:fibronectin type 3 domain-containing protein/V8-like Glu-specific endopeptidase
MAKMLALRLLIGAKLRLFTIIALLILLVLPGWAQVSRPAKPASWRFLLSKPVAAVVIPPPTLEQIISQESAQTKDEPFQFGYAYDVAYNLQNSGSWRELPDGTRVWRIHLQTAEAYSLNLVFDDFYLSPGAQFFVYTPDYQFLLGAFTADNNKPHGRFATAPTPGSECILELNEPPTEAGQSHFTISRIVYGYKDIFAIIKQSIAGAGSCNVNVNAPVGAEWQNEKRAVALVITDEGRRICSGALINNVREDYSQYFLTANHCLGGEETWIVMFNYEVPYGATGDGPTNYTVQGAILRAQNAASDFALVELTETIPVEYRVYFAGWNTLTDGIAQTTCIHHPMGDVKKISQDYQTPRSYTWSNTPPNSHWEVVWDLGTTEPGSSGAPLFDQNHRIIGQLHGGYASCDNPYGSDYFGKMSFSWNYSNLSNKQLQAWLDPQNTGRRMLDGRDYYTIALKHEPLKDTEDITKPYVITAQVITYKPPISYVHLVWGFDGNLTNTVAMEPTTEDYYQAQIPASQSVQRICYYFEALDASGQVVRLPRQAPQQFFAFMAGTDTTKPVIQHQPLTELPRSFLPVEIKAIVTDNQEVDTVYGEFYLNTPAQVQSFGLQRVSDDQFAGIIPVAADQLQPGDLIGYRLIAIDKAIIPNQSMLPVTGYFTFTVQDYRAQVLLIDDDPPNYDDLGNELEEGSVARIRTVLTEEGYYVRTISSSAAVETNEPFDLVVVASGDNPEPLQQVDWRRQLQAWLTDPQHKLLIEGGNLAFAFPGLAERDTAFAHQVLHIDSWRGDYAGDLLLDPTLWYHPVATRNHNLGERISLQYQNTTDQDAVQPRPPAKGIYLNAAQPQTAAIVVYDQNEHPRSGQVVYCPINLNALSDTTARQLVSNAVAYLLDEERPPVGGIQGHVTLADRLDHSGVTLQLQGTLDTAMTSNSAGEFSFNELFDGYYNLSVHYPGYYCADSLRTFLLIEQNQLTSLDFFLEPIQPSRITGQVLLEGETEHSGVLISLLDRNRQVKSDSDGSFVIEAISPGPVSILVQKLGFMPLRIDTALSNGANLSLTVTMQRFLPPPLNLQATAVEQVVHLTWLAAGSCAESFEAGLPADWLVGNYGSDPHGRTWAVTSNNAFQGTQSVFCAFGQPAEISNEWLITNPILISPQAYVLKFYHIGGFIDDDNRPNHVRVSKSTLDTADFEIVYTIPGEPGSLPNVWTQVAIDLSPYMGQQVYIAFQYQSQFGEIWYIDEVTLEDNLVVQPPPEKRLQLPANKAAFSGLAPIVQHQLPSRLGIQSLELREYQLFRGNGGDVNSTTQFYLGSVPADCLAFSDSSVQERQTYTYGVAALYAGYGSSDLSSKVTVTLINQPPPSPENFTAILTDSTVQLSWSPVMVSDLAGYQLWRAFGLEDYHLRAVTTACSFTDTLRTEGPYRYYLIAVDCGIPPLESPPSEICLIRYGKQPPENLQARSGLDSRVSLSWSQPVLSKSYHPGASPPPTTENLDLLAYRIYRTTSSPAHPVPSNLLAELPYNFHEEESYDDRSVSNDTTYYYVVTALYQSGESIPSNEVCATPRVQYPLILSVIERVDSLMLLWQDKALDSASLPAGARYQLYRSADGEQFNLVADNLSGTTYHDENLTAGTTYWYYLNAIRPDSQILVSNVAQAKFLSHAKVIWYDDFESGQIDRHYSLWDLDGQPAFVCAEPLTFQPFAWMMRSGPAFPAYSGNYCLGTGYNQNGTPNEDWLVLPPFRSESDDVKDIFLELYLSSQCDTALEAATVELSTVGGWPAEWRLLAEINPVPATPHWQRVIVEVAPQPGNVYLAICCRSQNKFVLKLDNLGLYGSGQMFFDAVGSNPKPHRLALLPNYPNPFNANTIINYELPAVTRVQLVIYDLNGRQVKRLYEGLQPAGNYQITWDGHSDYGQRLASGIYLCRLETESMALIQKLLLLK